MAGNPRYILRLALEGGFNGIAVQVGLAEKFCREYAGEVPLILKLHGKTDIPADYEALSPLHASVADAVRLGADAVGYTLSVGTPAQARDFAQYRAVREEAHRLGMPLVVWAYPRGSARDLLPAIAVVRRDGRRHQVPVADLVPGDIVLLAAGDRVSADLRTEVATGLAVDESLLTAESVPRRADAGEALFAGTFVTDPRRNPLLLLAVASELGLLAVFLGAPPVARLLGGAWPTAAGWTFAVLAGPLLLASDTLDKWR